MQQNEPKKPQPPFETKELRRRLAAFMRQPFEEKHVGSYSCGVYAFFDYDGEPIYVGQTYEGLSSRVGRHLTNQRTDAVAMSVLDPFEVCEIELFPLPLFQGVKSKNPRYEEAKAALNALELAVFERCVRESEFNAVLNEKNPAKAGQLSSLPKSVRGPVVSDEVRALRGHPDVRIARRAQTISRLAQVISERQVQPGLRRTLLTQAKRLEALAQKQFIAWGGENEVPKESPEDADNN